MHYFGKNPNPDSEYKNGFFVSLANPERDYESNESVRNEDSMDYSESGFLECTTFVFLWERIRKKSIW